MHDFGGIKKPQPFRYWQHLVLALAPGSTGCIGEKPRSGVGISSDTDAGMEFFLGFIWVHFGDLEMNRQSAGSKGRFTAWCMSFCVPVSCGYFARVTLSLQAADSVTPLAVTTQAIVQN